MVRRHSSAVRRAAAAMGGLLLLMVGCGTADIIAPESDEPFLYLVLGWPSSQSYYGPVGITQPALLLTAGSPIESPRYRLAQRFEMRRASDGAPFDWRAYSNLIDEPGTSSSIGLDKANYYLPEESSGNGLAYRDLEPGETYELEIETEGVVLRGRATMPESFTVHVLVQDGHRIAVWPRVRGAGGYIVVAYPYPGELQADTTYVIPADVPAGTGLGVRALDENLYRYLADERVGRSGIDRGYGVFGAVVSASVTVPERP
ncbi:MAG TPA: hypothetical protein VF192_17235 [Longimicrobiales bacterium]